MLWNRIVVRHCMFSQHPFSGTCQLKILCRGDSSMFCQCWEGHIRGRTSKARGRWAKRIENTSKVNADSRFRESEFSPSRPFSLLSLLIAAWADVLSLNRTLQTCSGCRSYQAIFQKTVQSQKGPALHTTWILSPGKSWELDCFGRRSLWYVFLVLFFAGVKEKQFDGPWRPATLIVTRMWQSRIEYIRYIQISSAPPNLRDLRAACQTI